MAQEKQEEKQQGQRENVAKRLQEASDEHAKVAKEGKVTMTWFVVLE